MKKITILIVFITNILLLVSCNKVVSNKVVLLNDIDSSIIDSAEFKNGMRNGVSIGFYRSGILHDSSFYINNLLEGKRSEYFDNGTIRNVTYYMKGLLNGFCFRYHSNGNLAKKSYYLNNKEIGWVYEFDTIGALMESREYIWVDKEIYLNSILKYNQKNDSIDCNGSFAIKVVLNTDSIKLGDTLVVSASIYNSLKSRYKDHYMMKLVVGDFTEDFVPVDSNSLKGIASPTKDSLCIKYIPKNKGLNILKGYASRDSTFVPGIPYPALGSKIYFTHSYYVE